MRFISTFWTLATCGAFSAAAFAQDSVSKLNALPGDAVDSRDTAEQVNDFIVDQTIVRGSWGTVFGVAPIVKTSLERNTSPSFFNALAGAQYLAQDLRANVPFARPSYSVWNAQGFGVNNNPLRNDPGLGISSAGLLGFQTAVVTADFTGANAGAGTANMANVVGAYINYTGSRPSRLHVSRVVAANNAPSEVCSHGAFGIGSIDADGNAHFRVDGNGSSPVVNCPGAINATGSNNYGYRVNLGSRTPLATNVVSNTGASDVAATTTLFSNQPIHSCPNGLPASVATRPVYIAPSFAKEYAYESSAGVITRTLAHFGAGVVDHRGLMGFRAGSVSYLGANSIGVCGVLGKATLGSADGAPYINLWGVDANGNITGTRSIQLPPTLVVPGMITDPDQPVWTSANVTGPSEFDHYHSQVAFQGGSSQIAIGFDQAGNLIAAAVVYYGLTYTVAPALNPHNQEPNNYIAVVRIDPTGATETWSTAGWTQQTTVPVFSDGKDIYQNGTTVIGRLTGASFGPPMSAPMIDSVGNIYFLSAIELDGPPVVTTTGLLRAIYDPTTFSYKLELVCKVGDVLRGRNSATDYLIRFLEIADSNSVSSATAFSGNLAPYAFQGQSTVGMSTSDSRTLGGLVIHASILYDVNDDGLFERSVGTGGVPGSPDEDYEVLLYLSSAIDLNNNDIPDDSELPGTPFCAGDNLDPSVTTDCPCSNFGTVGRGCASSFNASGARLAVTGSVPANTVVLNADGVNNAGNVIFMRGDANNVVGTVFGDGVRCVDGVLRRRTKPIFSPGLASFPAPADTVTLSNGWGAGNDTPPGSAITAYYMAYYRNAAAIFCPPETFNGTNGIVITW